MAICYTAFLKFKLQEMKKISDYVNMRYLIMEVRNIWALNLKDFKIKQKAEVKSIRTLLTIRFLKIH